MYGSAPYHLMCAKEAASLEYLKDKRIQGTGDSRGA